MKDKKTKKNQVNLEITPNTNRVILRRLNFSSAFSAGGVLIAGQLKAGENLFVGEILDAGDTKFKLGQIVYYSEYSASAMINVGSIVRGEQSLGQAMRNIVFVVAADDIMACEKPELKAPQDDEDFNPAAAFNKPVGDLRGQGIVTTELKT